MYIMINTDERDNIVNKLREEYPIETQVLFNEFTISDKLQDNMKLKIKYQEHYDHENYIYHKLKEKLDILICNRYDYYRFESDRNLTKTEIENYYIPADKKIRKVKDIVEKQYIKVKFFELCVKAINELYWRIKAYIDNEKV